MTNSASGHPKTLVANVFLEEGTLVTRGAVDCLIWTVGRFGCVCFVRWQDNNSQQALAVAALVLIVHHALRVVPHNGQTTVAPQKCQPQDQEN